MAISSTLYRLLKQLKPLLPHGGTLLEIGEANWYGDIDPAEAGDISGLDLNAPSSGFDLCKVFYRELFAPTRTVAFDFNGTEQAIRHDLNMPTGVINPEQFDVVINHGTAEHIFNIAQVFKTMHDRCEVGGLMIHEAPFTGWIDHGFYCLQPTLFYDLAAANNYEIVRMALHEIKSKHIAYIESREHVAKMAEAGEIPNNSLLFVVLRKIVDADFRLPMQGVYSQNFSAAGREAWGRLR